MSPLGTEFGTEFDIRVILELGLSVSEGPSPVDFDFSADRRRDQRGFLQVLDSEGIRIPFLLDIDNDGIADFDRATRQFAFTYTGVLSTSPLNCWFFFFRTLVAQQWCALSPSGRRGCSCSRTLVGSQPSRELPSIIWFFFFRTLVAQQWCALSPFVARLQH